MWGNPIQSWILDSTSWILDPRYRILESLSMECGFRIPDGSGIRIPWVVFRILKAGFRISQAKLSWIPDSLTYGDSYVDEIAWSYHSNKTSFVEPCMTQIICIIWWLYNKNLNFLGNFHNGHYQKWKGQITAKIFSRNIRSRFLPMLVSQDSKTAAMLVLNCFLMLTPFSLPRDWKLPITEKPKLRTLSALSMETRLMAPVLPAVQFFFVWKPLNCRLMYNNSYWKSCENYCFKSYHIFEIQNNVSEDRWQFPRCLPYNDKNSNEVSLGLQERCCFSSHSLFSVERLTRSHVDKKIIARETFLLWNDIIF